MGKGEHLHSPGNVVMFFCAVNVVYNLSTRSIDALFLIHVVSFWGLHPQAPSGVLPLNPAAKLLSFTPFNLPTPGKNPTGAHVCQV